VTLTEPLNPFFGATETVTVELTLPITAEADTGETDKLKSCTGGGGGWLLPPHAASASESASVASDSEIALDVNRVLISGPVRATGKPKISIYLKGYSCRDKLFTKAGDSLSLRMATKGE
jgi:hypothetical protein